jgi:hypothetical protein
MHRRKLLLGETSKEKKLVFIDEATEKVNESVEESIDEIMNLKVPELIWLKAIENLKDDYDLLEINIRFLSVLMKYGNKLNYKRMKDIIIQKIRDNYESTTELECKIIKSKLEKYTDDQEYLKKAGKKFTRLFENNEAISFYVETIKQRVKKSEDELNNYINSQILGYINTEDMITNYDKPYIVRLSKFIFESLLFVKNAKAAELETTIVKIIDNIIASNKCEAFNDYFDSYWKFLVYNKNNDIEQIYNHILNVILTSKTNYKFYLILINNLCNLIEEDIKIFPSKFPDYFKKIDDIIKTKKIRDLETLRNIWKRLLEILLNNIISLLPQDLTYAKFSIENDYLEYVKIIKSKMNGYLINYTSILNELKVIF